MESLFTTLCYIERDDRYLMMHRVKKENDINRDKWIGIGGHFLPGESPEECLLREVINLSVEDPTEALYGVTDVHHHS